jgi:three-Cys-motif partner protein
MPSKNFHKEPFDEETLTKLQIFELYTQTWLPVFLSKSEPPFKELHVFDFFCGPGTDVNGELGSPLRILKKFHECKELHGWKKVKKVVHFSDAASQKIEELARHLALPKWQSNDVQIQPLTAIPFNLALQNNKSILADKNKAKLLFIDQFGVNEVTAEIFKQLLSFPTTDFLLFVATSTLHRFRTHPAIKIKIKEVSDPYEIHRAVCAYFREIAGEAYVGQFSLKKTDNGNIYGLIFGTKHPLGMQKFLEVAWKNDSVRGEANFDVDREKFDASQTTFDFVRPKKIEIFEHRLEESLRNGDLKTEEALLRFCFWHGMIGKHAKSVIDKLKKEKVIKCDFSSPDAKHIKEKRKIQNINS